MDLLVTVPYGQPIPELIREMRNSVIRRVRTLTGLEVTKVDITVRDVFLPQR